MKKKSEFPIVYRDCICEHGCPSILHRDNAKEEQSEAVLAIQRELYIGDQFSEAYNYQQNKVELGAIKWIKEHVSIVLDCTGAPKFLLVSLCTVSLYAT